MQKSKIKVPKESAMADLEANHKQEEKIDRISNLPTPLIARILSFLPTKEAVATSTLSSSWRTLWTEVPDIHFWRKEDDRRRTTRATRLCDVIDRALILRRYPTIEKFRLRASIDSDGCDSIKIGSWIFTAVAKKIEALELSLSCKTANAMVQLPPCLFTCKTIKVLKLCGCFDVDIPYAVHLPSLKILHLDSIRWGLDSDVRILSRCPVLEECSIKIVDKDVHPAIRVCVPSLKKLSILFWFCRVGEIIMNTPSLEYLDIQTFDVEKYVMGDMQSLVEARMNVTLRGPPISAFSNLPEALCNAKLLRLFSVKTLFEEDIQRHRPTVFHNLVRLEITLPYPSMEFLIDFLRQCPKLEVIVILEVHETYEYGPTNWVEPIQVPDCVSSHLNEVTFCDYDGYGGFEIAAYILKHARVLKKFKVTMSNSNWISEASKLDVLKSLALLPRGSNMCQLEFD